MLVVWVLKKIYKAIKYVVMKVYKGIKWLVLKMMSPLIKGGKKGVEVIN